jgi:predicted P-loop ATPase
LIAAVRRVRQPGVKFDHLVVLEGGQGIGKSTAISTMFGPEWTTDDLPPDLGNKDAALALSGVWCIELAEIEQLIRSEAETVKAFLSRSIDRFRPPYGRHVVTVPRQSVMVGTTNSSDYLRDTTGNRRIWPVQCLSTETADVDWIAEHRDQLWAEAAHRERTGEAIWLDDVAVRGRAVSEQADRVVEDPWDDKVASYVLLPRRHIGVKTADILVDGVFVTTPLQTRSAQMRVAAILKRLGWKQGKPEWDSEEGKTKRLWYPPKGL